MRTAEVDQEHGRPNRFSVLQQPPVIPRCPGRNQQVEQKKEKKEKNGKILEPPVPTLTRYTFSYRGFCLRPLLGDRSRRPQLNHSDHR